MVRYNGKYDILNEYISDSNIRFVPTGNGEFVIGKNAGVEYFIKRNMNVRKPTTDLPKDVYVLLNETATYIEKKQLAIKNKLKDLSVNTDYVVIEEDHFWDIDQRFVTVTRKIGNHIKDGFNFTLLSKVDFIELMIKMTVLLEKIHKRGVIHGDLKEGNFIFTSVSKDVVPYLIDFDSSYLTTQVPAWDKTTFSNGYQSPEVAIYTYDQDALPSSSITTATDIFTLGIIFHKLWTNQFPMINTPKISVGEALAMGESIVIDRKFDNTIGENCGATLLSLLNWMLQFDYTKRPSATEIIQVLNDQIGVPEAYQIGKDIKPFDPLWDSHLKTALPKTIEELKKLGVTSLKQINEGGYPKYVVKKDTGKSVYTIDELCKHNYAIRLNADIDEAWPEHQVQFIPANEIADKGYISIKRHESLNQKRYLIKTVSGITFDRGFSWLLKEGLVNYHMDEVAETDSPWPEHGLSYADALFLDRHKIQSITRYDDAGEHRYTVVYRDGSKNQSVSHKNLTMMGLIKK